ncbi:MAG: type II secretion system F family protein [bacterium]
MRHIFEWIDLINVLNYWLRVRGQRVILINIIRQLALMIKMDLSITEGLAILTQDLPARFFMKEIKGIISDIEEGNSISESLKKHPRLFPESYLPMIKIGEQSGNLHKILEFSVGYLEQTEETRQKIGIALAYPGQLMLIAMGIFVFIQTFVIPAFDEVYSSFGQALPLPSQIVFKAFTLFADYMVPCLIIFGVILFVLILTRRLIFVERLLLLVPFFGQLLQKKAQYQQRTLFYLIDNWLR